MRTWLDYIAKIHTSAIDLGLQRILPIATHLQLTHFLCPVITVGGTNGKGSVVETLQQIYKAAGYKVAAYTSPHVLCFNERLCVNGVMVADDVWMQAFAVIEAARAGRSISFFEFTTLAALWICQQQKLDILILEVGLGGRLDAVNIVDASVAVITNIDIDHVDWLGDDREKIAIEKAGIFRSKQKVVCGDPDPPHSLLKMAADCEAELFCFNRDYRVQLQESHWNWIGPNKIYSALPVAQLRLQNNATAIMAAELLGLPRSDEVVYHAVRNAKLTGRYEKLKLHCQVIFDVAHNPQATRDLQERFARENVQGRRFAVVGMLRDKDIRASLTPFIATIDVWYVASLQCPRAAEGVEIVTILTENGATTCYNFESVATAFQAALENSSVQDSILVFGSFHTVADAKHSLVGT
ncbi:MAG: hypothetical protein A3F10_01535 [Coxiella sp. RIFCSPHIGHO2_12_FULL_42_15]|nr:MAG: hypothetical protein A3F10_01535 [Coxiella sp. RIFCSPHIGHO2_12_FULL_42_15]